MTAPGGGGGDEIREQLAAGLWKGVQEASWATGVAMLDSDVAAFSERLADELLPIVRALIAKGAAAELRGMGRAALRATPGAAPVTVPDGDLYARAEALDGTP